MGLLGEASDITWSMTSFFAVSENSKSAESINFGTNRKKIENWAIPYKELTFLMVKKLLSIKSFDDVIKMLKEKNVFKDIWLLAAQSEMKR